MGSNETIRVDVRLMAATNRDLLRAVERHEFREDLFYRLARAVLSVPPLRERVGCLQALVDHQLQRLNTLYEDDPLYGSPKELAPSARRALADYDWPGNVRELFATLERAVLWSSHDIIDGTDIREALIPTARRRVADEPILGLPIENGVDILGLVNRVKHHYVAAALRATGGNKTRAAELVGLASPVTLQNWMAKLGLS